MHARVHHAPEGRQAGTLVSNFVSTELSMISIYNYLPDKPKMCNVPSLDKVCTNQLVVDTELANR